MTEDGTMSEARMMKEDKRRGLLHSFLFLYPKIHTQEERRGEKVGGEKEGSRLAGPTVCEILQQ